jgi:hypothetical protein
MVEDMEGDVLCTSNANEDDDDDRFVAVVVNAVVVDVRNAVWKRMVHVFVVSRCCRTTTNTANTSIAILRTKRRMVSMKTRERER